MTRYVIILAILALVGCQEIAAPVEQPIREVAPSWCAMYLEEPEGFVYADSGVTCPDERQARAVEIWWPSGGESCGERIHLGPRARNRWGCSPASDADAIQL